MAGRVGRKEIPRTFPVFYFKEKTPGKKAHCEPLSTTNNEGNEPEKFIHFSLQPSLAPEVRHSRALRMGRIDTERASHGLMRSGYQAQGRENRLLAGNSQAQTSSSSFH